MDPEDDPDRHDGGEANDEHADTGEDDDGDGLTPLDALVSWIEAHRLELTRNVANQVRYWITKAGGDIAANDPELLLEAESAVGITCVLLQARPQDFNHSPPVRIRRYIVVRASGFVMTSLRESWATLPTDDLSASPAPSLGQTDADVWLLSLPRGRPAKPLAQAVHLYAEGEDLPTIASAVRSFGLDISDGQVAVELLRVLRFVKKGHPELAHFLKQARTRLRPALVDHLFASGLHNTRLVEVVADRATGIPDTQTARRLQVTPGRIRTLRHEARRHQCVRECLEDDGQAFGWSLG